MEEPKRKRKRYSSMICIKAKISIAHQKGKMASRGVRGFQLFSRLFSSVTSRPISIPWIYKIPISSFTTVTSLKVSSRGNMNTKLVPQVFKRRLFLQSQPTPNPDSVKFLPGREVIPDGNSIDFPNAQAAQISPLAKRLFQIQGISSVFLGPDFVTVTKKEDVNWSVLRPEIFEAILEFYNSDEPVLLEKLPDSDTTIRPEDDEVVAMIKELLETRIKPAVAEDGGNILYRGFHPDTGIVDLELQGSCTTCSSSVVTLKSGVENMLMHYIPEVKGVREVVSEEREKMERVSREQLQSLEQRLRDSGVLRS